MKWNQDHNSPYCPARFCKLNEGYVSMMSSRDGDVGLRALQAGQNPLHTSMSLDLKLPQMRIATGMVCEESLVHSRLARTGRRILMTAAIVGRSCVISR